MTETAPTAPDEQTAGAPGTSSLGEIFRVALRLGLTSFGGPTAHLGYFRAEYVVRRRWLDERSYADLVALCQFLPGPASSQVGIGIGTLRGGLLGGIAAWLGFTMPSVLLLVAFAFGVERFAVADSGWLHGLEVAAVAVVAQAVWGMARQFCTDRPRATIAVVAAIVALLAPNALGQLGVIAGAGVIGWRLLATEAAPPVAPSRARSIGALRSPASSSSSSCSPGCHSCALSHRAGGWRCWTASTARARWSSAAGTSSCRCCKPPRSTPAG